MVWGTERQPRSCGFTPAEGEGESYPSSPRSAGAGRHAVLSEQRRTDTGTNKTRGQRHERGMTRPAERRTPVDQVTHGRSVPPPKWDSVLQRLSERSKPRAPQSEPARLGARTRMIPAARTGLTQVDAEVRRQLPAGGRAKDLALPRMTTILVPGTAGARCAGTHTIANLPEHASRVRQQVLAASHAQRGGRDPRISG